MKQYVERALEEQAGLRLEEIKLFNNSQRNRYLKKPRTQPDSFHQLHRLQRSSRQHMA